MHTFSIEQKICTPKKPPTSPTANSHASRFARTVSAPRHRINICASVPRLKIQNLLESIIPIDIHSVKAAEKDRATSIQRPFARRLIRIPECGGWRMAARTGADKPYTTSPFKTSRACAHVFYTPSPPSPKKKNESFARWSNYPRAEKIDATSGARARGGERKIRTYTCRRALRFFIRLLGGDGGSLF